MAMRCSECGGIIPDIMVNTTNSCDCKNHSKPILDIDMDKWHGRPQLKCVNATEEVTEERK